MSPQDVYLEFKLLGPLEVRQAGRPLPVRGRREQAILAMLLLAEGGLVTMDRLVEAVWDGCPPPGAVKAVRNSVSALRRRPAEVGGQPLAIPPTPAGYQLPLRGATLDAACFRRRAEDARLLAGQGRAAAAAGGLRRALSLWRGPVLGGAGGAILRNCAATLDELRVRALEDCLDLELALGRHREVTAELAGLAREWPLRERIWGQLMLALYRSGRQEEALDTYRRLAGRLAEDLGLDPGPELGRLHAALLRHDPSLDLSGAGVFPGARPSPRPHQVTRPAHRPCPSRTRHHAYRIHRN